jgi:hypothetical protein
MIILRKQIRFTFLLALMALILAACGPQNVDSAPIEITATALPADNTLASETAVPIAESAPTEQPEATETPIPATLPAGDATETAVPIDVTPTAQPVDECPQATAESQRLYNPNHGYCLLYPAEYKVEKPTPEETVLVIGGLLNPSDPRVFMNVTPTDGRSADEIADQIVADLGSGGEVERSSITLGGETAVRLDGLPGQDTSRRIIAVHEGQQYTLTFSPLNTDAGVGLETLYTQIVDTFTFVTPMAGEFDDCLQATDQTQLLWQEEQGICLLLPADYQSEQPTDNQTAVYVDSLLNSGRPRLFIEVADAGDKTAADVADELLADFGPDFGIERSFGLTLGYEIAEQLDNVPGQDISRVVLVVHDGRLYKLTFIPASEDAGELYEEMEALYDLVIKSFRFLP